MKNFLKLKLSLALISSLFLLGCHPPEPRTPAQQDVADAFQHFQDVVSQHDSLRASHLLSTESLVDYGRFRRLALHATASQVHGMTVGEKYFTLGLRQMSTAQAIEKMSDKDVFRFFMDKGMTMNKNLISHITLGKISISGGVANAAVLINQEPANKLSLLFLKEDGSWKVDVRNLLRVGDKAISRAAKEHNIAEDEIVTKGLEAISKKKLPPDIWAPLVKNTR
jgi:hypothetical protein